MNRQFPYIFPALAICLSTAAGLLAHQISATGDATEGARLYQLSCILCHGPDGRSVPGVALGTGEFQHASSDDDLVRIIRQGLPGTSMPAARLSETEAANIVAYLRTMQSPVEPDASGDVSRGKVVFEGKGECLTCHRIGRRASGSPDLRGPSLSRIGRIRKSDELRQSILDPNAEVLFSYRMFTGITRDGATITGRLLNEDTFTVQILDRVNRLISLTKSDLRRYEFLNQSTMPSYRDRLTPQELADLVAYLASL